MGRSILQNYMPTVGPMNPIQQFQMLRQAMSNPAAFLKEKFPDIPDQIMNDPGQIMQYLQQSRGLGQNQMQQMQNAAWPVYQQYQNMK